MKKTLSIIVLLCFVLTTYSQDNEIVSTWRQPMPGGYADWTKYKNGDAKVVSVQACTICHGTKRCHLCFGRGGNQIGFRYGYWHVCGSCNGNGICRTCLGKGEIVTTSYITKDSQLFSYSSNGTSSTAGPGYGTIINPNGRIHYYSNGGSSDTDNHETTKERAGYGSSSCQECKGTGLDAVAMYAGDSDLVGSAVGLIGYTHSSGSICKYCKETRWHVHYKCTSCRYNEIR